MYDMSQRPGAGVACGMITMQEEKKPCRRHKMRWGERLEFVAEAGPGDFIHVPPYVPHQEINASANEPLSCVVCRSGQEPVVVNLDIPVAENPEQVYWVDNIHPYPHTEKSG